MTIRPFRRVALLGAILLGLSACGGSSSGTTAPTLPSLNEAAADAEPMNTTTTVEVDPEEAFAEYAACMREHGVEMPDPNSGGGVIEIGGDGMDLEAMEEASQACDPILEAAFGEFEMSPEQEVEIRDQELAFAQCMRDNGIDWPDPSGDFGSGGMTIEVGDDVDPDTMNAAIDTCSNDVYGSAGGGISIGGNVEITP